MTATYTPDTRGFYEKFIVTRQDGTRVEGPTFTLRPYDPHAQIALMAYAASVEPQNPQLAADLRALAKQHCDFPDALDGRYLTQDEINNYELSADSAVDCAIDKFRQHPIPIQDGDGNIVAYVKNEYDPGTPDVRYLPNGDPGYPGEPGHNYWRFLTVEEIAQLAASEE